MLRSLIAVLVLRTQAPARELRTPRVTNTIIDGRVSPEREAELVETGRRAVAQAMAQRHACRGAT